MPDEGKTQNQDTMLVEVCDLWQNEWKSVINARVKGTVCPVCADRAVLAG